MNGTPPVTPISFRTRISREIADAVPNYINADLTDLIAEYADENTLAELPLELDQRQGRVIDNETNKKIKDALKRVLTSANEPERKWIIFKHLSDIHHMFRSEINSKNTSFSQLYAYTFYQSAFNTILDEIRNAGIHINLDYTDFTGITFASLDLTGASAVGAKFMDGAVLDTRWTGGDFTGALFKRMSFKEVNLVDATLYKSAWEKCHLDECWLDRTDLEKMAMLDVKFTSVTADQVITDDEKLKAIISNSPKKYYSTHHGDIAGFRLDVGLPKKSQHESPLLNCSFTTT